MPPRPLQHFRFWLKNLPRAPRERKSFLVAIYLFWRERFTPLGRVAGGLWLFAVFLESLPRLSGMWPLLALLSSAFIVSFCRSFRAPQGTLELLAPPPATVGASFVLHAEPSAEARTKGHSLGIFDLQGNLDFAEGAPTSPFAVEGKALKRGVFALGKIMLLQAEPFGLMRSRKSIPTHAQVVVWPVPLPPEEIVPLLMQEGAKIGLFGGNTTAARGGEFAGIRPYRAGDSRRDLHQQAFARYGKPFTREYESGNQGATLIFCTECETWEERASFEHSVSMAAGFADWLSARRLLHAFYIDETEIPLGPDPRNAKRSIFNALAASTPSVRANRIRPHIRPHIKNSQKALLLRASSCQCL
jgi:uncharacterized protein (DUF58 family)